MTKGEFSPVAQEEGGKQKEKSNLKRILLIIGIILVVILVLVLVISLVVHFTKKSSSNDGISHHPEDSIIRFEQGRLSTYENYTDALTSLLEKYQNENQQGEDIMDCSQERGPLPPGKVCRFDIATLDRECTPQKDYGYDEGQPCIFLSFDKMKGWKPEVTNESMPAEVLKRYLPGYIPVSCEGVDNPDRENIGEVSYYPPAGFPEVFFPYSGQPEYIEPLVAVHFRRPLNGVIIHVRCKAWVKNTVKSTTFYLMVD